jgi:ketosteroid isomerase-like protein
MKDSGQDAQDIRRKIVEMLEARMAGDIDRLARYFSNDVFIHIASSRVGLFGPGTWRGTEALRSIMRLSDENYQPLEHEILDIIIDGEDAVVRWRGDWRRHATGKVYPIDAAHFLRWRDGLAIEMYEFFERVSHPTPLPLLSADRALSDVPPPAGLSREEIARCARQLVSFPSSGPDVRLIRELCDPNIVCDFVGDRARIPYAGRYVGVEALVNIVKAVAGEFEQSHEEIPRMLIDGPRVAGFRSVRWRHHGTGRSGLVDLANFVRFENGKIVELIEFRDSVTLSEMRGDGDF